MGSTNYFCGYLATILALSFAVGSCHKNSTSGVPIYIRVDSPTVVAGGPFGSATSSISGVWATSGGQNLGAYEMPVNIPILPQSGALISLSAGIYDNGIITNPVEYPFYTPDTFTISNPIPGHVYVHHPVYHYVPYATVGFLEDFTTSTQLSNITAIRDTASPSLYQDSVGAFTIGATVQSDTAIQSGTFTISAPGGHCYMELDWRINNPNVYLTDAGLLATSFAGTTVTARDYYSPVVLQPLGHWQKTYIDLDYVTNVTSGVQFQVYFAAHHTLGVQDTVFLDNIKVLYF